MTSGGPPQQRLDHQYVIEERLGSGGFSTVWRAKDTEEGPDIAVKFPKEGTETEHTADEVTARFRQEYDFHSQLEGVPVPSSIARFVTGSRSDPAYIGMEYLDGSELGSILTETEIRPSPQTMRSYGLPVIRALGYLHHNDMCHLDCKPDNVMVRIATKSPALIDFNTVAPTTDAGDTLFYEDGYKPPEQTPSNRRYEPVGPWSDVYAAGKLLCYLLTGQTRDTSETSDGGMNPIEYGASCGENVADLIQRATKADYEKRPTDGAQFMTELLGTLGEPTITGELRDTKTGKSCLVRPGDTVGRVTADNTLATITVEDLNQHISPVQFAFKYRDNWQIEDKSLNGTYINIDDEWVFLLSDAGYNKLSEANHDRVADGRPYSTAVVSGRTVVSPVDPSYPSTLVFTP